MDPSDKRATQGPMCNPVRQGLTSLSRSHTGPSAAHPSMEPITYSISAIVPIYGL